MNDDGLRFHAIILTAAGTRATRETDSRLELLAWIGQHQRAGDTVIEVGIAASGPAVQPMLAALTLGAANSLLRNQKP
jgi:hypothetical protein